MWTSVLFMLSEFLNYRALEEAMSVPMHPALSEMTAVKDRNNSLENLKKCVTRCLSHYINDQLIKISVDYGSVRTIEYAYY